MATPGQLRSVISAALGLPEPTVVVHDRNLAEAGHRSTGGRGRSAAKVTPIDAANLLIAIVGSSAVKDTVATLTDYADLPATETEASLPQGGMNGNAPPEWRLPGFNLPALTSLGPTHGFRDALAAIIQSAADGALEAARLSVPPRQHGNHLIPSFWGIEVRLFGPDTAQADIRIMAGGMIERHRYSSIPTDMDDVKAWAAGMEANPPGDLRQVRTFTQRTLLALGELLAPSTPIIAERQTSITVPGASAPGQHEEEA